MANGESVRLPLSGPRALRVHSYTRRIAAVAVAGLIVVALILLDLAYRYDPICAAPTCFSQSGSYVTAADGKELSYRITSFAGPWSHGLWGMTTGVELWREPPGMHRVQVIVGLKNMGHFGVTIDAVRPAPGVRDVRSLRAYFYKKGPNGSNDGAPLRPFSLPARSGRLVVISYRQPCVPAANRPSSGVSAAPPPPELRRTAVLGADSVSVHYSFMGFEHTTSAIISGYAFAGPKHC